jgi:isoleucyl-tRNA synthetase
MQFFEVLNNWYIRRNKERFWSSVPELESGIGNQESGDKAELNNSILDSQFSILKADKQAAYDTLYTVLSTMCRAAAPLLPLTLDDIYKGLTGEESVHLATFPSSSASEASPGIHTSSGTHGKVDPRIAPGGTPEDDEQLIAQMDRVRDVCNAALAIRSKNNIRVRQPLALLTFVGKGWAQDKRWAAIEGGVEYLLLVQDEVNAKDMCVELDITRYATLKLSLNNQILGKRLPEKMKQIIPASKKGEWKQVDGTVEICGEKLLAGEYTLQLEPKPEYKDRAQALSTNDALVILDTTVTPELEAEGIARDMVRAIQQARKDGGLNVSDRIRLHLDAPANIASAINTHSAYILEQTLSTELLDKLPADKIFSAESAIDDKKVVITLAKAA